VIVAPSINVQTYLLTYPNQMKKKQTFLIFVCHHNASPRHRCP